MNVIAVMLHASVKKQNKIHNRFEFRFLFVLREFSGAFLGKLALSAAFVPESSGSNC
jgi:hypothetical protein